MTPWYSWGLHSVGNGGLGGIEGRGTARLLSAGSSRNLEALCVNWRVSHGFTSVGRIVEASVSIERKAYIAARSVGKAAEVKPAEAHCSRKRW